MAEIGVQVTIRQGCDQAITIVGRAHEMNFQLGHITPAAEVTEQANRPDASFLDLDTGVHFAGRQASALLHVELRRAAVVPIP